MFRIPSQISQDKKLRHYCSQCLSPMPSDSQNAYCETCLKEAKEFTDSRYNIKAKVKKPARIKSGDYFIALSKELDNQLKSIGR